MNSRYSGGAIFSRDGLYRYVLWRNWDERPYLLWVMLNPSRANATQDDPALKRCVDFSQQWGYGGLVIVNLFAYCTPYVRELYKAPDPIGSMNDLYLSSAARQATDIVVAWGRHGVYRRRDRAVLNLLSLYAPPRQLFCLGMVQNGCPRYPARMPRTAVLQPYRRYI